MDSGKRIDSGKGYSYFLPNLLSNVEKELDISTIQKDIEKANLAIGELRALEKMLPNPKLLTERYALKEAVLSSQIEGTQSTLAEIIEKENEQTNDKDIIEVRNYFDALEFGIKNIQLPQGLPLSARLLRECHNILMKDVRGGENHKTPGEFRKSQNWIGGDTPSTSRYVPPAYTEIGDLMTDMEKYLHDGIHPNLVKAALIHYQFETIHPFLDGNGRIGRLLISLFLIDKEILQHPTLYISLYLKQLQSQYYESLTAVRQTGDYIQWIKFFLEGVVRVSEQIMNTTRRIIELENRGRAIVKTKNELRLLEYLFRKPIITIKEAENVLGVTNATAGAVIKKLEQYGILEQSNDKQRYRKYAYRDYLNTIDAGL